MESATEGWPSSVHDWSYCCAPSSTPLVTRRGVLVTTTLRIRTKAVVGAAGVELLELLAAGRRGRTAGASAAGRRAGGRRCPSLPLAPLMMMSANWSGSTSRPRVFTVSWNCVPLGAGGPPICPAATCMFCCEMAVTTSAALTPRAAILSGSSQTRML